MVRRWRLGRGDGSPGPVEDGSVVLEPGERVLVSARTADESWVVGTDRSLHLADGTVLGWHQVDQARWLDEDQALEILTLPEGATPPRSYRVQIPVPGRLPELVRERVTSNIVVSERVALIGRRGARIVARRLPGGDDIRWSVIYDAGIPQNDAGIQAVTRDAVERLKVRLGV